MFLGSWITKIKLLILCYSLDMQEVMQKRLAIVVMMVMTALKISLAVGFLLKNDIFTNFFFNFFYYNNNSFSPERRGALLIGEEWFLPKGREFYFFRKLPRPLLT